MFLEMFFLKCCTLGGECFLFLSEMFEILDIRISIFLFLLDFSGENGLGFRDFLEVESFKVSG